MDNKKKMYLARDTVICYLKNSLTLLTIYTVKISTSLRWCTTGYSYSALSRLGLSPIVLGPGLLLYLRILACGA